jgi:class 3 adenylate cyclase
VEAGPLIRSVHAARVAAAARPNEILVTRTVHDLVAGARFNFTSQGFTEPPAIEGTHEIFMVKP